jgi:hypothetical protein
MRTEGYVVRRKQRLRNPGYVVPRRRELLPFTGEPLSNSCIGAARSRIWLPDRPEWRDRIRRIAAPAQFWEPRMMEKSHTKVARYLGAFLSLTAALGLTLLAAPFL